MRARTVVACTPRGRPVSAARRGACSASRARSASSPARQGNGAGSSSTQGGEDVNEPNARSDGAVTGGAYAAPMPTLTAGAADRALLRKAALAVLAEGGDDADAAERAVAALSARPALAPP